MALTLLDYVGAYATVRGLLGVAEEEVPDTIFSADLNFPLLQEVTFTLEDLNEDVPTLYETAKDAVTATPTPTATAAQTRFYNTVRLYAAYLVANNIATGSVEMFAPVKITDGKAMQQRSDPYASLRASLQASLALWRARLGAALTALDATKTITASSTPTLVGSAGLAIDPVTGA